MNDYSCNCTPKFNPTDVNAKMSAAADIASRIFAPKNIKTLPILEFMPKTAYTYVYIESINPYNGKLEGELKGLNITNENIELNANGIEKIEKAETHNPEIPENVDEYFIYYTNGTTPYKFTVTNAPKIEIGPNGNWWIGGEDSFVSATVDTSKFYTKEEINELFIKNVYKLQVASSSQLGGIKVGNDFDINADGTLSIYKQLELKSISNSAYKNILGQIVDNVTIFWNFNKAPSNLSINGVKLQNEISGNYTFKNQVLDKFTTYTITASDNRDFVVSDSTTVNFYHYVYYGASPTFNQSHLKKVASNINLKTFNAIAGENDFIYYAIPTKFKTPSFFVNGFEGGFILENKTNLTNEFGYTESYSIYRTVNLNLGNTTVEVI